MYPAITISAAAYVGAAVGHPLLVRDDAQNRPLGREPEHSLDEVCAERAVDPRCAQDHVMPQAARTARSPASLLRP